MRHRYFVEKVRFFANDELTCSIFRVCIFIHNKPHYIIEPSKICEWV